MIKPMRRRRITCWRRCSSKWVRVSAINSDRKLLDHYTAWGAKTEAQRKLDDKADAETANNMLAEMLVKMGKGLGYQFDKVYIKKGFYYPEGLGNIEQEQHALRRSLLALLSGKGMKLPVALFRQDFQPLSPAVNQGDAPPLGLRPPSIRSLLSAKSEEIGRAHV